MTFAMNSGEDNCDDESTIICSDDGDVTKNYNNKSNKKQQKRHRIRKKVNKNVNNLI